MVLEDVFCLSPSFFYPSTTRPPYFYPSIFVFTRPNDGWTGLYIKPCLSFERVKSIFGWLIFFEGQNTGFNYVVNFVLKMGVTFVNAWIFMVKTNIVTPM